MFDFMLDLYLENNFEHWERAIGKSLFSIQIFRFSGMHFKLICVCAYMLSTTSIQLAHVIHKA